MSESKSTWFDYENQAWVVNGAYRRCGHPASMNCQCFGRLHAGEKPSPEIEMEYGPADAHLNAGARS